MRRVLLMLMLAVLLTGCDKLKGDQGEKGDPGAAATASAYEGAITSDYVSISIEELNKDELPIVNVYCSDGSGEWLEIPVYNFSTGGNVVAVISKGKIEIHYAYSNWFREYYIVIAAYPHAPVYQRLL